jgi:hypothetical protein
MGTENTEPRNIRCTIGEYTPGHFVPGVAGQYQQMPAPLGGGIVKLDWFRRYPAEALPAAFERVVQSWDTANKTCELADFSDCTSLGHHKPRALSARL